MNTVLAGDLGGTKCRLALVSADFRVSAVQQFATIRDRAAFLVAFDAALEAVLAAVPAGLPPVRAAGFGTAGVLSPSGDRIEHAPNLPLDGFPLAEHVRQRHGLATTVLNDGRASALGEYLCGEAAGKDPLLCLFFGTGIGIGLIVGGRPYAGASQAAGEIGHTIFQPGGRRCPCGGLGHFEAYCGGRAITERAAAEIAAAPPGLPAGSPWTVGAVVAAASSQDAAQQQAAAAILRDAETAAITMVANACTLLNPAAVVLGGGVLDGWPTLRSRLLAAVPGLTSVPIHRSLQWARSHGGSDAILWGAAAATGQLLSPVL